MIADTVSETRPVWLIGLSFDSKPRKLVDFGMEKFKAGGL